jgi:transcriptional regulator with GAF, ATPase, and Fis domain
MCLTWWCDDLVTEHMDLAEWFADMARNLLSRGGVADTLNETCQLAVAVIPGCQSAGISQVHRNQRIETPAATSPTAEKLHTAQYELNDGPCMDAAWKQHTISIPDMTAEDRWPRFAEQAVQLGVHSMLCFQLYTHQDTLGALNLFSDNADAFDEHAKELGLVFASHTAVAMAGAQNEATLKSAISSRQHICEAVGILAARHHITTTDAFRMLSKASQDRNFPLRELAARLVQAENAAARTPR